MTSMIRKLAVLLVATTQMSVGSTCMAEAWHYIQIVNNSNYDYKLSTAYDWKDNPSYVITQCVTWDANHRWDNVTGTDGLVVPHGRTTTFQWNDSNNIDGQTPGPYTCIDTIKLDAVTVTGPDLPPFIDGALKFGSIHRKFGGDWYNGFFYFNWINAKRLGGVIRDSDYDSGYPPPPWMHFLCNGDKEDNCLSNFKSMYWDGKDSDNWSHFYRSESQKIVIDAH